MFTMPKEIDIKKEELYDLYINKNMTRKQCADYFGCSDPCIKIKIRKYGIQKPKNLENKNKIRRETLVCKYCGNPFEVEKFRANNERYLRKNCSYKCASAAMELGEEHKKLNRTINSARRRARMQEAFDPSADYDAIKQIYFTARQMSIETGIKYEVDHIIPISKGGKHHQDNLQIITMTENRKKGSKIV